MLSMPKLFQKRKKIVDKDETFTARADVIFTQFFNPTPFIFKPLDGKMQQYSSCRAHFHPTVISSIVCGLIDEVVFEPLPLPREKQYT